MLSRFLLLAVLLLANPLRADDQKARDENLKLREEVVKLREALVEQQQKALQLAKQADEAKRREVAARLQEQQLRARAEQLLKRVRELEKEIARLKSTTPGRPRERNIPAEKVEGKVKRVGPDGLMVLSVGTDAGLLKGDQLKLFRLDPKPENSKYLGTIEIVEVRATEAVARPTGKLLTPVQPGDRVASSLLKEEKE